MLEATLNNPQTFFVFAGAAVIVMGVITADTSNGLGRALRSAAGPFVLGLIMVLVAIYGLPNLSAVGSFFSDVFGCIGSVLSTLWIPYLMGWPVAARIEFVRSCRKRRPEPHYDAIFFAIFWPIMALIATVKLVFRWGIIKPVNATIFRPVAVDPAPLDEAAVDEVLEEGKKITTPIIPTPTIPTATVTEGLMIESEPAPRKVVLDANLLYPCMCHMTGAGDLCKRCASARLT